VPKVVLVEMRVWSDPTDIDVEGFSKSDFAGSYYIPVEQIERLVPKELWKDIEYCPEEA
jgi:hypothetical protein